MYRLAVVVGRFEPCPGDREAGVYGFDAVGRVLKLNSFFDNHATVRVSPVRADHRVVRVSQVT